jgi:hypothetical protein
VATSEYGSKIYVWNWQERTLRDTIELGAEGVDTWQRVLAGAYGGDVAVPPCAASLRMRCPSGTVTAGLIPLETRFLHDPSSPNAFVGAALSSNIISLVVDEASGKVGCGSL